MAVNATLWAAGLESSIRPAGNIGFVGPFRPTTYAFEGYVKGMRPSDIAGWDSPIPKRKNAVESRVVGRRASA